MCERASNSGMLVRSTSVLCDELTAIVSVRLGSAIAGKGLLACTEVGPLDSPTVPWGSALHVSHHSYRVDERDGPVLEGRPLSSAQTRARWHCAGSLQISCKAAAELTFYKIQAFGLKPLPSGSVFNQLLFIKCW